MDKIVIAIRKIMFLIAASICIYFSIKNYELSGVRLDSSLRILDNSDDFYFEALTENTGYISTNGVSRFYNNILEDGYSIYSEDISATHMDIIFTKQDCPTFRLYYKYPECYIAVFSSKYENSGESFSYIIEE